MQRRALPSLDSNRVSATLLLSGEMSSFGLALHAHTEFLTDLMHADWLLLDSLCGRYVLYRRGMGNLAAEYPAQNRRVVRENLRVVRAA